MTDTALRCPIDPDDETLGCGSSNVTDPRPDGYCECRDCGRVFLAFYAQSLAEQDRATLVVDEAHYTYPGFWAGHGGFCRLRVFDTAVGRVAVATEPDDNTGPSITNCAENLWLKVHEQHGPLDLAVEHYPAKPPIRGATYDRVVINENSHAEWRHLPADKVLDLIGYDIDQEGPRP